MFLISTCGEESMKYTPASWATTNRRARSCRSKSCITGFRLRSKRSRPWASDSARIVLESMDRQLTPFSYKSTDPYQADTRDLGFGSVVARESRQRLLNRDGSFNVVRAGLGLMASLNLYHTLLTISWRKFFGLTVLFYFGA